MNNRLSRVKHVTGDGPWRHHPHLIPAPQRHVSASNGWRVYSEAKWSQISTLICYFWRYSAIAPFNMVSPPVVSEQMYGMSSTLNIVIWSVLRIFANKSHAYLCQNWRTREQHRSVYLIQKTKQSKHHGSQCSGSGVRTVVSIQDLCR